jgi:hypothetical protein
MENAIISEKNDDVKQGSGEKHSQRNVGKVGSNLLIYTPKHTIKLHISTSVRRHNLFFCLET